MAGVRPGARASIEPSGLALSQVLEGSEKIVRASVGPLFWTFGSTVLCLSARIPVQWYGTGYYCSGTDNSHWIDPTW